MFFCEFTKGLFEKLSVYMKQVPLISCVVKVSRLPVYFIKTADDFCAKK